MTGTSPARKRARLSQNPGITPAFGGYIHGEQQFVRSRLARGDRFDTVQQRTVGGVDDDHCNSDAN